MKQWKCMNDYQNGGFMVGEIRDLEGWRRAFYDALSEMPMTKSMETMLNELNEENIIDFANDEMCLDLVEVKLRYQVFIELTADANGEPLSENLPLLDSPFFDTMDEADSWYRQLQINYENLDIILATIDQKGDIIDTDLY